MPIVKLKYTYIKSLIIILLFISTVFKIYYAQQKVDSLYIEKLLNEAEQYKIVMMYSKSDSLYRRSILLAKNKFPYLYFKASISLAELNRKTGYFNQGKEILLQLSENKVPELEVSRYARLAAIYNEIPEKEGVFYKDSVFYYLFKAKMLAEKNNLKKHLAVIYNELGFTLDRTLKAEEALDYLKKSRELFLQVADSENYANATLNYLNVLWNLKKINEFKKLSVELYDFIKDKKWYALKARFFNEVQVNYFSLEKDSLKILKAKLEAKNNELLDYKMKNDLKFKNIQVIHKTEELNNKTIALKKEVQLQQKANEIARKKNIFLTFFLIMLIILLIKIIYSYTLNKKLNKQLKISNKNYQILLAEVKHRVKNNLQSTIGILDFQIEQFYNGKSIEEITLSTQNRLKSIAVLHDKLLNKNQIVNQDIKKYFQEIIELNKQSSTNPKKINNVKLKCNVKNCDQDKLMYMGIFISELMINSFKYAFENIEKPEITINIIQTDNYILFNYEDNGKGFNINKVKKGTGMTIIEGLVSQMQGEYFIQSDNNGTKININFKS